MRRNGSNWVNWSQRTTLRPARSGEIRRQGQSSVGVDQRPRLHQRTSGPRHHLSCGEADADGVRKMSDIDHREVRPVYEKSYHKHSDAEALGYDETPKDFTNNQDQMIDRCKTCRGSWSSAEGQDILEGKLSDSELLGDRGTFQTTGSTRVQRLRRRNQRLGRGAATIEVLSTATASLLKQGLCASADFG